MEKKLPDALEQIVASFATARPLRVMFQDEARFGRISRNRYCWAPRPLRPMVKASLTHEYTYAYGAVSPMDGRFDSLVLPHVNTECMQLFINEIADRCPQENIIMVVDGAGWHRANALTMPDNIRLHFLPPYSPELNRRNTSGTSSGRSTSITKSSRASTPWKINLLLVSHTSNSTRTWSDQSPDGSG